MVSSRARSTLAFAATLGCALAACDSGSVQPEAPPAALSIVQATAASSTEVLLSWAPPPSGVVVQEFRIERALADGVFVQIATVAGDATSYRDTGLTPATAYSYRVRVCGEGGCSPYTSANVTTLAPLVITTTSLKDGFRGEAYNGGVSASGGAGGYVWTVISGSLPAGLTLSELGIISGIPLTAQTAIFVARVRSDDGQTASQEFTLRVLDVGPGVFIDTPRLPPALAGAPFEVMLRASGGDGTLFVWSLVGGSPPAGITLSSGGVFAGAPANPGTFSFTVRVSSGGRAQDKPFTLRVVANDASRFQITPFEVATVPADIRPHLDAAIARWERVITGDLGATQIPQRFFSATACGGYGDLVNGTSVDDVIVMMDISPIDGAGKILGQAGPCGIRSGSRLTFVGVLTLDSDDLAPLVGTQTLTDIIFHEIGHVLGFGGLWASVGLITGGGTNNPRFTGALANQQFAALGGVGQVPIENSGGAGTADSHWKESVFRTEIMTGFAEPIGTRQPLSRVTIASMADMGYTVNLAEADAFVLPGTSGAPSLVPREPLGYDVVLPGPVLVLPEMPPR